MKFLADRNRKVTFDNSAYENIIESFSAHKGNPLKIWFSIYKGNGKDLAISFFFFIIKNMPVWVLPIVTSNIITICANPGTHKLDEIWINVVVAAVIIAQNVLTHVIHIDFYSKVSRNTEAKIRGALVRKLQRLSISYHKDLQSGRIQSKVLRDVEAIEFLSSSMINTLLPIFLNVAVALSVTISKSWIVTVFFFVTIPVAVLFVWAFRKNMRARNAEFRHEVEKMSSNMAEMVEMIPVTRAHALEEIEIERLDGQLSNVRKSGRSLDMLNALFGSSSWVTMQLFQVGCLLFTGIMAFNGRIDIGDIFLFQTYFSQLLGQVMSLINIYPALTKGFESINSIGEIMQTKDIEDYNGKLKLEDIKGEIEFRDVKFSYIDSDAHVLNHFNFKIKEGECVAFVGESGAGKSTILNMIIGFCKPKAGQLLFDGVDSSTIDYRSFREHIAVVPQNAILFSGTIRDNITYGMQGITDDMLMKVMEETNLKEFIESLPHGLDTFIGEHGGKLSGGQKQRITIARAIIRNPKIIILDEATSALDNASEKQVQKAINNAAKGRTTLIVAHRLSTIKDADRIAFLKNGVCTECGTYDELLERKGDFYKMTQV